MPSDYEHPTTCLACIWPAAANGVWLQLAPLNTKSTRFTNASDLHQEQMPGCCEADCRALALVQTLLTGSYSDPRVRWWEVSIFSPDCKRGISIRLISRHSWQEGTCEGLCFSLWQIFPRVPLGQTLLNVVELAGMCAQKAAQVREPQGSPSSPAPATPPADSLVRSSQNSRDHWGLSHQPLSQSLARDFWLPVERRESTVGFIFRG